ncbi:sugar phosphate isomerase/epimerase family protein [Leifsonia sp. 2MCAF36]|uniref:sugar phosphate isomerase/epimerase family protein n=1 Tax=Leifsonia sp. 2MCAF36 TaxID=3232988 RepID=UPI003F9BA3D3
MSKQPYSVQLYTLRKSLEIDLAATLTQVAGMGFKAVELYRIEQYADQYAEALASTRLTPLSAHATLVEGNAELALASAARLGVGTVIDPKISPARWTTRQNIESAASELNEIARRGRDHGVTVGYHNHDHELRASVDGTTGLEIFADALDDDVILEVDTFWVEIGGASAPELLSRLGRKVQFIHVKDGPYSTVLADQKPVGQGQMPIAEILRAAPDAVRIVELDDYTGDPMSAVEESLRYLEGAEI